MAAKSLLQKMTIFCYCKKATAGSSFCGIQKKEFLKKLGANSWIGYLYQIIPVKLPDKLVLCPLTNLKLNLNKQVF
jgi:hypothetical protein